MNMNTPTKANISTPTKANINTPTKASSHFNNFRYDNERKKNLMTCKHCLSVLVDSKNSTCFTSHLKSCQPSLPLTNKVNGDQVIGDNIQIKWRSSDSSGSPPPTTPSKQMKDTPLKTMLLSKTPYQTNCVERKNSWTCLSN